MTWIFKPRHLKLGCKQKRFCWSNFEWLRSTCKNSILKISISNLPYNCGTNIVIYCLKMIFTSLSTFCWIGPIQLEWFSLTAKTEIHCLAYGLKKDQSPTDCKDKRKNIKYLRYTDLNRLKKTTIKVHRGYINKEMRFISKVLFH